MSVCRYFVSGARAATLTATASILALPGCDRADKTKSTASAPRPVQMEQTQEWNLPVISGAGLQKLVRESNEPVLVEFGVNFNCVRCDEMRPQLGRLASDFEGRANVVRVDFNANRGLVARYGGKICPSYVLFQNGKPIITRSYPISVELLTADLSAAAARNDHQAAPSADGGKWHRAPAL